MSLSKKIRLASSEDVSSILKIYAPFITDTVITFEYEVPDIEEFEKRMANIQKKYPWLVCEIDGDIAGYAYASQFNNRAAYDWSCDFSIYIKPKYHRKGIGKALYFALMEILKLQGCCNAYAGVTLPNIKSEGLHKSLGFKPIGVYESVGYKFGKWHDVKWFGLKIQDYPENPEKPKVIDDIKKWPEFNKIIKKAEDIIKGI